MYYSAFVDLIRKLVVLVPATSPHVPKTGFHFLGIIKHSKEEDNYGEEISHVYYQHVRQLLLSQEKVTDMQNFQILDEAAFRDLLYPEEIIEDALFLLEEIALLNGHLYKLNEWYALNEFIIGNAAVLDNPFIQENEAQDFLNQLTTLYEALILKQPDCSVPKLEAVADSEGKIVLVPEMSLDIENFYEDLFSTTDPEKTPQLEMTYPPYSSTYIKKESEGITTIELALPAEYEQAIIKLVPRSAHRVFETYEPFFGAKITIGSDNVVSFRGNTPHVTHEPIKVTDISDRIDAVGIHYNHNTNSYGFSLGNNIYGTMPEAEGLSTVDPQFLDLVVEVTGATQGSKVIVYQDNTLFTLNHPKGSKTVCGELVETYRGNVDLRTLNAALDWVERIRTNPDEYTTASTEDLFALADRVKEDIKALYLTQDDVNGYVGELSELLRWVDHHQYFSDFTVKMIEIVADKSQLQALVDESQQIQQGNYNLCSWNYFQLALTKLGEPALANENSSQLAVDDAYSVLLAAKNGLTENSHDFTQLQALLDEASEYVSFNSVFDEWLEVVRWVACANTLMSTSGCFNNSLVGDVEVGLREAIDNYHQAILDAMPDYKSEWSMLLEELDRAIENKESLYEGDSPLDPEHYPEDSWNTFMAAVGDFKAAYMDLNLNEDDSQQAFLAFENALLALYGDYMGEVTPPDPEGCVYPLDVKPELIQPLGFNPFSLGDSCGHILTSSGADSHAAISQEAAEALLSEGQIPEEHILPPRYLGDGVYAVEYLVSVTNVEDKDGIFAIAVGGYRPLTPEHGGGNCNVVLTRQGDVVVMGVGAISHDQNTADREFPEQTNVRLGLYYNTTTKQVGFNIAGEDVGYLGEYTHDEPFILMAAKQAWVVPEFNLSADVSIEVFTRGEDLQFTYPSGTVGLDGEPVKFQQ